MGLQVRAACGRRGLLLASTSLTALLIGGGAPSAALASCLNVSGSYFNLSGTVPGVCISDRTFSGLVLNAGTIGQSGIIITNSRIIGSIADSGNIRASTWGIAIDGTSEIKTNLTDVYIS